MFLKSLLPGLFLCLSYLVSAQSSAQTHGYPFPLQPQEQVVSTISLPGKQIAFLVKFDPKLKYTRLKAVIYSLQNRQKLQERTIDSVSISPWQTHPLKGKVRQTFGNAVLSGRRNNDQAPLEYQYQVHVSPDSKFILCYRYDYSQPDLYAEAFIVESSLQSIKQVQLPIDEGMTNHGLYINNSGELFILNTDEQDGISFMRYQPATGNVDLVEISASSTRRNSFIPVFAADETIYLGGISENNGSLTGLMCSRLNFKTSRVEEALFFPLSKAMLESIQKLPGKGRYELIDFKPETNRFSFELQKRNIAATEYEYDPYAVNDLSQWTTRKIQAQLGEKLLLGFDAEGKVIAEKIIEGVETY